MTNPTPKQRLIEAVKEEIRLHPDGDPSIEFCEIEWSQGYRAGCKEALKLIEEILE